MGCCFRIGKSKKCFGRGDRNTDQTSMNTEPVPDPVQNEPVFDPAPLTAPMVVTTPVVSAPHSVPAQVVSAPQPVFAQSPVSVGPPVYTGHPVTSIPGQQEQSLPVGLIVCAAGFLLLIPFLLLACFLLKPNKRTRGDSLNRAE